MRRNRTTSNDEDTPSSPAAVDADTGLAIVQDPDAGERGEHPPGMGAGFASFEDFGPLYSAAARLVREGPRKTFTPPQPRGADTASWPALLHEDPTRLWQPRDIAAHFGDITLETMYRQLNRWAASGPIHKLGPGLYAATPWSPTPLA